MKETSTGAKLLAFALVLSAAAGAWVGCDDHDHDDGHSHEDGGSSHTSPYPSCQAITSACHEVDVGDGPIHDCHDKAHAAKSDSDCAPIKDNCVQICQAAAADGGAHGDGGAGGDGGEHGH